MAYAMDYRNRGQVMTASGLDVLAAIWLIISPFVLRFQSEVATRNDVILGIVIGILALVRFLGAYGASWLSWVNVILGVWVLLSPWILGFSRFPTATWNNVILGILVIILAGWSALATDTSHGTTGYRENRM